MTFDPLRCAEATGQAAAVLGLAVLPAASRALDGSAATAVLAAMLVVISAVIYALHAVTFDFFRLTGQRDRRIP